MLTVALVSFGLFRYIGDPVNNMVGQEATMAGREALRTSLGLNDPVPLQFLRFVANAAQGEFGVSYRKVRPVADVIAERLPATLELALISGFGALALQIGSIIAFAIITETAFQWPGVGLHFITAVQFVDIPVMAAYLVLIVDLLYFVVDPRLLDSDLFHRFVRSPITVLSALVVLAILVALDGVSFDIARGELLPARRARCRQEAPALRELDDGRVACHAVEEERDTMPAGADRPEEAS